MPCIVPDSTPEYRVSIYQEVKRPFWSKKPKHVPLLSFIYTPDQVFASKDRYGTIWFGNKMMIAGGQWSYWFAQEIEVQDG